MVYIIYKHTNTITKKAYVGMTGCDNNVTYEDAMTDRWNQHCYCALKPQYYFHRSIAKYGQDVWIHEILANSNNLSEAFQLEMQFITTEHTYVLDSLGKGYNLTKGGQGSNGLVWTSESLKKISGEKGPNAKLRDQDVIDMKMIYTHDELDQCDLAVLFNVTQSTISRALSAKTFKHVKIDVDSEKKIEEIIFQRLNKRVVSNQTREKISHNRKGSGNGMFRKFGEMNPNFGRKHSDESKQRMRIKALERERKKREI